MFDYNIQNRTQGENGPIMIMIHGFGANKNDLFGLREFFPKNFTIISLEAPYELLYGGRHWYNIEWIGNEKRINKEQAVKSKNDIISFIENLKSDHTYTELYVLGFSQGAILSHAISLERPELVDSLIAFSGYIDEDIFELSVDKSQISSVKRFMSHGIFDEVIPVEQANDASNFLKKHNIEHFYKTYSLPHSLNEEVIKDLLEWMYGR